MENVFGKNLEERAQHLPTAKATGAAGLTRLSWMRATNSALASAGVPETVRARITRLACSDIDFAVHAPVMTVDDVVRVLGIAPESIVKSLVLETRSGATALASVAGCDRLDLRRCERQIGEPIRLVPEARLELATTIPRGALSPLAWDGGTSLLDAGLAQAPLFFTGSGINTVSLRAGLSILSGLPDVRLGELRERTERDTALPHYTR